MSATSTHQLTDVFRFLSPPRAGHTQGPAAGSSTAPSVYAGFQSSYFNFCSHRRDSAAASCTEAEAAPRKTSSVVFDVPHEAAETSISVATPHHAAAAAAAGTDAVIDRAAALLDELSRSVPDAEDSGTAAAIDAAVALSPSPKADTRAPSRFSNHSLPASPERRNSNRAASASLEPSIGSMELPAEQQPEPGVASPRAHNGFSDTTTPNATQSEEWLHLVSSTSALKELESSGRGRGRLGESDTERRQGSEMIHHSTESRTPTENRTPAAPGLRLTSAALASGRREGRSSLVASMHMSKPGSPLFSISERDAMRQSGSRRVSLRRPVFDIEDDDVNE